MFAIPKARNVTRKFKSFRLTFITTSHGIVLLHRVNTDVEVKETFLKWCIIQGEKKKKKRKKTTETVTYATNRNIALSTYVNKI